MMNPAYVNVCPMFYPIGNTPATNFLRDTEFPPDHGVVKILSLGCGDPRNILYTLWHEDDSQSFDFTACDLEPAVIARNVILLALMYEGEHHSKAAWNLFYHLFIRQVDTQILLTTVRNLLAASETRNAWKQSIYGRTISFSGDATFTITRNYWRRYEESLTMNPTEKTRLRHQVKSNIQHIQNEFVGEGFSVSGRSAGARAAAAPEVLTSAFERFWKTGVVGGNADDLNELDADSRNIANPLFAVSSAPFGRYAVHYGTDPLHGFHLAQCFDGHAPPAVDFLVAIAKSQFKEWCNAYAQRARERLVKIKYHHGDAISFCYKLQRHPEQAFPLRIGPWHAGELILDDELSQKTACDSFDVIDTSNLVDSVGILSIIPAAVPLLRRLQTSVFYTESLLPAAQDPSETLETMLYSDVTTASLIIGLAPVGHLLRVSTDVQSAQATANSLSGSTGQQRQLLIRVPWKRPNPWIGKYPKVSVDSAGLAEYFFKMYLKLFAYEDWTQLVSLIRRQIIAPLAGDLRFYHRPSLVFFLKFIRSNIETDWERCMKEFLEKVLTDRTLPIGSNQVQELQTWLHVQGLYKDRFLQTPLLDRYIAQRASGRSRSILKILFANPTSPSIIHVALVVPRNKLRLFTSEAPEKVGSPPLHISISNLSVNAENAFFATQCFFGKLKPTTETDDAVDVEYDEAGWDGQSDLLATCLIPADTLLIGEAANTKIALVISTAPWTTTKYAFKLGPRMVVFESALDDVEHVRLLSKPPGILHHSTSSPFPDISRCDIVDSSPPTTTLGLDHTTKASVLRQKIMLRKDSPESALLSNGAEVVVSRTSPCSLDIQIGPQCRKLLSYPFPMDGAASHTRVSRKNSWVEVSVAPSAALDKGGYDPEHFPVVSNGQEQFSWGLSQVNIRRLPKVSLNSSFNWLRTHMTIASSASERHHEDRSLTQPTDNGLVGLKQSLSSIFETFNGRFHPLSRPGPFTGFRLTVGDNCCSPECCDTLIFCSAMYYDGSVSSVVMDAYLVAIDFTRLGEMQSALDQLPEGSMVCLTISREEQVLWKHMLPALVERCRRNYWAHGERCEYRTNAGMPPLSMKHGQSPICGCGEGKALEAYPKDQAYSGCARFATRIVLSPISAVPYVERLFEKESAGAGGLETSEASAADLRKKCDSCGSAKSNLKACSRCGQKWYCNHQCQKAAWKGHKKECNK